MKEHLLTADQYAIFQTGGKQYQAIVGQTIEIEKLDVEVGGEVIFDEVLLRRIGENKLEIGQPFLKAPIKATVVKHMKGPKLIAFMFKRRKKVHRKKGHRQLHTIVRVEAI